MIGIDIWDVFLISEYSYSNYGDQLDSRGGLNILKCVAVTIREACIQNTLGNTLGPEGDY